MRDTPYAHRYIRFASHLFVSPRAPGTAPARARGPGGDSGDTLVACYDFRRALIRNRYHFTFSATCGVGPAPLYVTDVE